MGNYVSKYILHNTTDENQREKEEEEEKETAVLGENIRCVTKEPSEEPGESAVNMHTPKANEKPFPLDPRSITVGITRTPIQIDSTPITIKKTISAIPRHLQPKQRYLETDLDKVMPRLTPKKRCIPRIAKVCSQTQLTDADVGHRALTPIEKDRFKILGIDPRSPAAGFNRTPILISTVAEHEVLTESPENLTGHGSYGSDGTSFSYCEMWSEFANVPEIQALPDVVSRVLKSMKLEDIGPINNHDALDRSDSSYNSDIETISEDSGDEADNNDCEKINSESVNAKTESVDQDCNKTESNIELITRQKTDNQIVIWNDSISAEHTENMKDIQNESNNESIKWKTTNIAKKKCSKRNSIKIEYDINSQNKKCTSTTKSDKVINKMENEAPKARTPLGNRSNNGQTQALLLKSPQQILRKKNVTQMMLQENTPPHKACVKSKLVQWDPDSTVLI